MSAMPMKQRAMMAVLGIVVFYAAAVLTWFMYSADAWKQAEKKYKNAVTKQTRERKLIREKDEWNAQYEEERAKMPLFAEEDKGVDTHWQGVLDDLAKEHHIAAPSRQVKAEEEAGDVRVLSVDMKNCECALGPLVAFLHGLQTKPGTMMDVASVDIRPASQHKGFLKCSFTVACAYMRGEK